MGLSLLAVYLIGALVSFRSAVRYGKTKSGYVYDMTDSHDVAQLTALATLAALWWPLVLVGGFVVVIVKRIYANTKDGY